MLNMSIGVDCFDLTAHHLTVSVQSRHTHLQLSVVAEQKCSAKT